jgi:hypothetical protein
MPAMPSFRLAGVWIDVAALLAVGGVTTAFAVWRMRGVRLVPIHDPNLPRALEYESP